jgi:two-component sensor histidine kinase
MNHTGVVIICQLNLKRCRFPEENMIAGIMYLYLVLSLINRYLDISKPERILIVKEHSVIRASFRDISGNHYVFNQSDTKSHPGLAKLTPAAFILKRINWQEAIILKPNLDIRSKLLTAPNQHDDCRAANIDLIWLGVVTLTFVLSVRFGYKVFVQSNLVKQKLISKEYEIRNAEAYIGQLLREKASLLLKNELLLKKVHHRVKNNLQVVKSLFSAQSAYLKNHAAKVAVDESQLSLEPMFLIHQKLYGAKEIQAIDMPMFLFDLTSFIADRYKEKGFALVFLPEINPINLDATQAMIIGLLINEIIAHVVKNEFQEVPPAQVHVHLSFTRNKELCLTMAYQGADRMLTGEITVLQVNWVSLAKLCRQLGAEPMIERNIVTKVTIIFKPIKEFYIINNNINYR